MPHKYSAAETLNPELLVIDSCRYRLNPIICISSNAPQTTESYRELEDELEDNLVCVPMQKFNDREEEEENEELEDIEQIWDDKFKLSRPVAAAFCRFIIGKKGETKRRLESETHSVITVPKQGVEGNVVITGSTRADVASCWRRIRLLIDSGRRKLAPTHFVSIPMTSRAIRAKFTEFKEKILAECPHSLGLDSSIFQEAEKLHITVGMLTLMNEAERNEAIQALIACGEEVVKPELKNEKWTLSMKGIEVMNDDAMAVDILFGRVSLKNDQSGVRLQTLVDEIAKYFQSKGLMYKEYDHVKLHITVINSKYRREEVDTKDHQPSRVTFDASQILEKFSDFDFGEQQLDSIQLSNRHGTGDSGYYYCLKELKLATLP